MKVVYLTTESLYGEINSGSLKCSFSNFTMLKKLAGDDLLHIYLDKEDKMIKSNKLYEFKRVEDKISKLILAFSNRRFLSHTQEKKIVNIVMENAPKILFYEGPYWAHVVEELKRLLPNTLFITFMHNIEVDYYANLNNKSFSQKLLYRVTAYCEKVSLDMADRIICLNARDAKQLKKTYNRDADLLLPINMQDVFEPHRVKNSHNKKTLLFIGSLFPPNYDGIKWFIDNVMIKLPDYQLVIVGNKFETVKEELERDNVLVIGGVKDLSEYYYDYPVLVMPILYGAGMKVKTAEAMMYGKTIVGTEEALEGYEACGIKGIYEANSVDEFVKAINKVFSKDEYLVMQKEVRNLFENNFETNKLSQNFCDKVNEWL